MDSSDIRFKIAASRRILAREGCESLVAGHVSAREEGTTNFWVSPFEYFDETTPDRIIKVDSDLGLLEGSWEASPAIEFHAAIYSERPDVNSVVHTHSPSVMVFATRPRTIGMYNVASALFYDEQVLFDQVEAVEKGLSAVDGKLLATTLDDKRVVLMKNHGAIVAGQSLEQATIEAIMLEKAAKYHLEAEATGGTEFPSHEALRGRERYRQYFVPNMWDANFRRLRRSDPDLFEYLG